MLVVGLMGIVVLGVAELFDFQLRSTKTAQNAADLAGFQQQLQQIIMREDSCTQTFQGLRAGDNVRYLRDRNSNIIYDATANPVTNTVPLPLTEYVVRGMRLLTQNQMASESTLPPSLSPSGAAILALRVDLAHTSLVNGVAANSYSSQNKILYFRVNALLSRPLFVGVDVRTTLERAQEICNSPTGNTQPEFQNSGDTLASMAVQEGLINNALAPSVSSFMSWEIIPGVYNGTYPAKQLICNFASYDVRIARCLGVGSN